MIDTKLLRQKILDLAIRGKLVPQDPTDEPASVLLQKIREEKAALVKAGKIKKDKHESFIFKGDDNRYYEQIDGKTVDITEEIPFDIPKSWEWCRIKNIGAINPRNSVHDDTHVSFMPMAQLEPGYGSHYTLSERQWREVKQGFTHFAENDVVIAKITPCFQNRKSAVMHGLKNGFGTGTTELHVFRGNPNHIYPEYVLVFFKSQRFIADAVATIQGVVGQQRIDANFVKEYLFPLPPLAEQKRIVSCLETILNYADRIDKDESILDELLALSKQKVLDLAIRGKLVPQDPADEPASELLNKIKAEKDALIKAGKLKRDKHESFIFRGDDNCYYEDDGKNKADISDQIPFDLPPSWAWSRIEAIADIERGSNFTKKDFVTSGSPCIHYGQIHTKFHYVAHEAISFIPTEIAKKCRKAKFGDVVMAVTSEDFNDVCKCVAWMNTAEAAVGGHTAIIRHSIDPMYLVLFFNTMFFSSQKAKDYHDGKVVEYPPSALWKVLIPLPPLAEQKRIVSQVEQIFAQLETMQD